MVTKFWIDSDDLATSELCARLHIEAEVFVDSFEIHDIRDEDTRRSISIDQLSISDQAQIMASIRGSMKDLNSDVWDRWVWGRDGI